MGRFVGGSLTQIHKGSPLSQRTSLRESANLLLTLSLCVKSDNVAKTTANGEMR